MIVFLLLARGQKGVGKARPEHPPNKSREYGILAVGKKSTARWTSVGRVSVVGLVIFLLLDLNGERQWCYCACACAERRENALGPMLRSKKRGPVGGHY